MTEQYQKGLLVSKYLERLHTHPVTIAEAVSDEYYQKSYQLITENPKITKAEFLKKDGDGGISGLRFSKSAEATETDNRYLDAVQKGDTETAQRMVDEAAKAAA